MNLKVSKWGNSIGVRLPHAITEQLHLHSGDKVHIELINNKIVMKPIQMTNRDIIKQALAKCSSTEKFDIMEYDSEIWDE